MDERHQPTGMLRPTLLIGAGGTGYDIVARAKARFYETYPASRLQQIRFIVFDTDTNHAPIQNSVGEMVRLTPDRELIQIGAVPVNGIIENKSSYLAYAAELDLDLLPRVDLTKGAKQVRQLGRLALFFHFERVRNVILDAMTSILSIDHYRDVGAERVQSINVFFVSSTCGGTGSGIMIDLAYLTRHLALSRGIPEDAVFNIGLFLMPDAYKVPQSNRKQIRANACAMLNEIDHFTQRGDFDTTFPDAFRVRDRRPPFHIAYLVDDTNERNLTVKNAGQLAAIMAEAIFLQAGSYVGLEAQSVFDNTPTAAANTDLSGFSRSYSTVGAATLRFNAQRMHRACARRLQRDLVRDVLLKKLPAYDPRLDRSENPIHPAARPRVDSFLAGAALRPLRLLDDALRLMPATEAGAGSMVVEINTQRLGREPRDRIVSRVENACHRYNETVVVGQFIRQIEINRRISGRKALDLLRDYVLTELDDVESGIHRAGIFLAGVGLELDQVQRELQTRQRANREALSRAERDVTTALDGFRKATQKFDGWGVWRKGLDEARNHYVQSYRQLQNLVLDATVISHSQILVNELRDGAQRLTAVLNVLRAALEESAGDADRDLEWLQGHWVTAYITEHNIDSAADIDSFFQGYLGGGLSATAEHFLARTRLRDWFARFEEVGEPTPATARPGDELRRSLERFAVATYQTLPDDQSIEKLLLERYPTPEARNRRLRDLLAAAAPFSNYDPTLAGIGSDDLDRIAILGVANEDQTIFDNTADIDENLMRISTFDQNRLSVLETRHGLPLHAVRQYDAYRKFLYRFLADSGRRIGFNCYRSVLGDLDMRRLFVLGEALGCIKLEEGVYQMADSQLGTTPAQVWAYLSAHPDTLGKLRACVAEWAKPARLPERTIALQTYLGRPRGAWPIYIDRDMRSLAQAELDFATELAAI